MENDTRELLEKLAGGEISVDDALLKLKLKPFEDIGYAKVDTHRSVRQGVAEVIYGAGKTTEQITGIAKKMLENGQKTILITRLSKESAEEIQKELDEVQSEQNSIKKKKEDISSQINDCIRQCTRLENEKTPTAVAGVELRLKSLVVKSLSLVSGRKIKK